MSGPLNQLAGAVDVAKITDFHHVPFGNSYFPTAACGGAPYDPTKRQCFETRCAGIPEPPEDCFAANMSQIVTQHGPQEYAFNRLAACAKDVTVQVRSRLSALTAVQRGDVIASDDRRLPLSQKGEPWYTRYWSFVYCSEDEYSSTPESALASCATKSNFTVDDTAYMSLCFGTPFGDASVLREAKATILHQGTPTVLVDGKDTQVGDVLKAVCAAYTGPKPQGCLTTWG